jgi:enamine deaminase RidA (YjgF/YER057c/UK114 family)
MTRHPMLDPEGMPEAVGFSHGVLSGEGQALFVAGQIGVAPDGSVPPGLVEQFGLACAAVARVIETGGGTPTDLVSLTIYTTDMDGYRRDPKGIGAAYREVFGKHFPAMALIGVSELFVPEALVELVAVAVVPFP